MRQWLVYRKERGKNERDDRAVEEGASANVKAEHEE